MAKEGLPILLFEAVLIFASYIIFYRVLNGGPFGTVVLSLLCVFFVFSIYFFRDPERKIPEGENLIVSPADGKIVDISTQQESFYCGREMIKISIFLNVFNVHVNRFPCEGRVEFFKYVPGKFFNAAKEKASLENEQTIIGIQTGTHGKILVKQIAGLIARRVVCRVSEGDSLERGDRFGMIRFGSRTDLFLPPGTELLIKKDQVVYGGETVIGKFPVESENSK
ncbi:MAG: phosphatidylserine decarboxylase family protein [Fibrobacterota bacterium]